MIINKEPQCKIILDSNCPCMKDVWCTKINLKDLLKQTLIVAIEIIFNCWINNVCTITFEWDNKVQSFDGLIIYGYQQNTIVT
jgi:hypothetical protein